MTVLVAATGRGVVRLDGEATVTLAEPARCLALGGALYAGTHTGAVHRSDDGGRSFRQVGSFAAPVTALAARGGTVYAGTKEPRVHVSEDGGASWRALPPFPRSWWWAQPAERPFRPSYVSALAFGDGVVAGIEACGVFLGEPWSSHRRRALRDCHELAADGDRLYEAGSGGLAESADGGRSWRRRRDGLDRRYGWSVAAAEGTVWLVAAPYRSAHTAHARACVFRSGGGAWERCLGELDSLPRLAAGRGEVFAALGDGTVLASGDRGATWTPLPTGLGAAARALVVLTV